MRELKPGVATFVFARVIDGCIARNTIALAALANEVVAEYKEFMGVQPTHPRNTPTPASPGGPPAQISGTLASSFGRSEVMRKSYGAAVEVGLKAGMYPGYRSKRTSSQYGYILDVAGCRNGVTYPFFANTVEAVVSNLAERVYDAAYGPAGWTRLA